MPPVEHRVVAMRPLRSKRRMLRLLPPPSQGYWRGGRVQAERRERRLENAILWAL